MTPQTSSNGAPLLLAFYLPQFHQTPENDAWHETGFTEWTVVARSQPLFPGHRQPELPGELGFYDLRVPETRAFQAQLASSHGIGGFLYYHYWFNGRQMLSRPLDEVLRSGQPNFPFALCWANESWFRRWQGTTDELLMEQEFNEADDVAHIQWMIERFKDPRYIRVNGRPLLTVYRAQSLPNPRQTVEIWRRECEAAGMEPPWLVMFETLDNLGDPSEYGFDASAEFVPHGVSGLVEPETMSMPGGRVNHLYTYEDVAAAYGKRPAPGWTRYPCVATAWDNSPRRQQGEALIIKGSTPARFGQWLRQAIRRQAKQTDGDQIVFVNAWNEWAEGAHLEPDAYWGRAYLEAVREVMAEECGFVPPAVGEEPASAEPTAIDELYVELHRSFVELQSMNSGYLSYADRRLKSWQDFYNRELAEARRETRTIAELNEALHGQLELQAKQLEIHESHMLARGDGRPTTTQ